MISRASIGQKGRVEGVNVPMKTLFIGVILGFVIFNVSVNAETVEGNKVYVDNARLYAEATPHTIQTGDDEIRFSFMSKSFSGNVDLALGFDTNIIKPKRASYWNGSYWKDISSQFERIDRDYGGMNAWFVTKDISINALQMYDLKIDFNVNALGNGKYWVCMKPSAQTIQQAIDANNFLCLDPWFNLSYYYKNKVWGNVSALSANTTALIPINITLNETKLFWTNATVSPVNNTIGYVYWSTDKITDTDFTFINPEETAEYAVIIDEGAGTDKGTKPIDLVLFHTFGGCSSTVCEDRSSYNNDATKTLSGTPFNITGVTGNGQECSGVRQEGFTVQDSDEIQLRDGDNWTTSVWIRPDTPTEAYSSIFEKGGNYQLFLLADRHLNSYIWFDSNSYSSTDTPASIVNYGGGWYHIAVVFDRQTNVSTIYVNGVNVTTSHGSGSNARILTNQLFICYNAGTVALNGGIDNLMIYDRAFNDDEIKLLYQSQLTPFPYGGLETSVFVPPAPPVVVPKVETFCADPYTLYSNERGIADNGTIILTPVYYHCEEGCDNFTIRNGLNPGCKENFMEYLLYFFIIVAVVAIVLRITRT